MRIASDLVAIDPDGCGCIDCMVGTYTPLHRADTHDIQALFLGIVADHTNTAWEIAQLLGGQFTVAADGHTFTLDHLALPITVDRYTVDLFPDTAAKYRHHLGAHPRDTAPVVLGPQHAPLAAH